MVMSWGNIRHRVKDGVGEEWPGRYWLEAGRVGLERELSTEELMFLYCGAGEDS